MIFDIWLLSDACLVIVVVAGGGERRVVKKIMHDEEKLCTASNEPQQSLAVCINLVTSAH
jgi:hypothetical protein